MCPTIHGYLFVVCRTEDVRVCHWWDLSCAASRRSSTHHPSLGGGSLLIMSHGGTADVTAKACPSNRGAGLTPACPVVRNRVMKTLPTLR